MSCYLLYILLLLIFFWYDCVLCWPSKKMVTLSALCHQKLGINFLLEACQFVRKKNVMSLSNVRFFNMKETEQFSQVHYLHFFLWELPCFSLLSKFLLDLN